MPIPFGCECGKRLQAKDEFAGKKMKCPGCGKLLTIPGAEAPPPRPDLIPVAAPRPAERLAAPSHGSSADFEAGPPLPSPAPLAVALVHFVCTCGRHLKARQADVGEEIECPDCGRTLRIPGADTGQPPPGGVPSFHLNAESFLSQTVTPWPDAETRRRDAGGKEPHDEKVGSRLGVFVLLLLLAAGAGAWWYFMPEIRAAVRAHEPNVAAVNVAGRASFDELKRVPADAVSLVTLRPGAFGAPKLGVKSSLAQQMLTALTLQLNRLGPVERMTWVVLAADKRLDATAGMPGNERNFWVVVRTARRYDINAIVKLFVPADADLGKQKYAGSVYLAASPKLNPQKGQFAAPPQARMPALFFLNENVFVFADTVSIKRFLRDARRETQGGPFEDALTLAAQGQGLVIGLNQTRNLLREKQAAVPDSPVPPLLPAMKQFSTAVVAVGEPAQAPEKALVETTVALKFLSPQAAQAAQKALLAWVDGQRQRRQEIVAQQAERAARVRTAFAVAALGSMVPGPFCPLAPLHLSLVAGELAPSAQDGRREILKDFAPPVLRGTTLRMTLVTPPRLAALASQLWAPYAELAINSTPAERIVTPQMPGKKGR